MSAAGSALSLASALTLFAIYLVPCAVEEVREAWRRTRMRVIVCRGCGSPHATTGAVTRDGIPFCSVLCAEEHPNHRPEEYHP